MKEYRNPYTRASHTWLKDTLYNFHPKFFYQKLSLFLTLLGAVATVILFFFSTSSEVRIFSLRVSVGLGLTVVILSGMEVFVERVKDLDEKALSGIQKVADTLPGPNLCILKMYQIYFCGVLGLVIVTLGIFLGISFSLFSILLLSMFFILLLPLTLGGLSKILEMQIVTNLIKQQIFIKDRQILEKVGNVHTVLMDKIDTLTKSEMHDLIPAVHVLPEELAKAAYFASLADSSLEGKSIIAFINKAYPHLAENLLKEHDKSNLPIYRKGAQSFIEKIIANSLPYDLENAAIMITKQGNTPLIITKNDRVLGIVVMREIVKHNVAELFEQLRNRRIHSTMLTASSWKVAAIIAKQSGLTDFQADISIAGKLHYLHNLQKQGKVVLALNLPQLEQADITVSQRVVGEANERADVVIEGEIAPEKIFALIDAGRQMLRVQGKLTVFTLTSTAARAFILLPPILSVFFPRLQILDFLSIGSAETAILGGIIYNMCSLIFLILLLRPGLHLSFLATQEKSARDLLYLYGALGVILPFLGIKGFAMWVKGG